MVKHKLDDEVEDVLKHWGIQGMKWDVRRSPEQIKADAEAGVNAVGETLEDAGDEVLGNDSVMGELGDVLDIVFGGEGNLKKETKQLVDATKDKLEDIGKDVKKRGFKMLERVFGKSQNKTVITGERTMTTIVNGKRKTVDLYPKRGNANKPKSKTKPPKRTSNSGDGMNIKGFVNKKNIHNGSMRPDLRKKKKDTNGGTNGNSFPRF